MRADYQQTFLQNVATYWLHLTRLLKAAVPLRDYEPDEGDQLNQGCAETWESHSEPLIAALSVFAEEVKAELECNFPLILSYTPRGPE